MIGPDWGDDDYIDIQKIQNENTLRNKKLEKEENKEQEKKRKCIA